MSDDKLTRRDLLRGKLKDDKEGKGSDGDGDGEDTGWKPGWEAVPQKAHEEKRAEVREEMGEIAEPDEKPFDALGFLAGLGEEGDNQSKRAGSASRTDEEKRRATIPVHRPPRALAEEEFLKACTRCEACIDACPHDAIRLAGPRLRQAAGTPVIDAATEPCWMCEDTPCVTACEPGALLSSLGLSMGSAQIQVHDCIAHQDGFCSTCIERCPVPGAIKVRDGKPTIRAAACTGCGVCHHVCPAPVNAVRIFPREIPEV